MARNARHVVHNPDGGWSVIKEGASRASKTFSKQSTAVNHAREIARKEGAEVYIHGKDGRIRDKDSYGNDPHPPRDKRH